MTCIPNRWGQLLCADKLIFFKRRDFMCGCRLDHSQTYLLCLIKNKCYCRGVFFTETANTLPFKINTRLQIWGRQHFYVLVVKLKHFFCKMQQNISFKCSLIISLQFGSCQVTLAVCIHMKYAKFHFIILPVMIIFEHRKPFMDLAFWEIFKVVFLCHANESM